MSLTVVPPPQQQLPFLGFPKSISYSQAKTMDECGFRYRLERGFGLGKRTYWASIGGSTVHTGTEVVDLLAAGQQRTPLEKPVLESLHTTESQGAAPGWVSEHWEFARRLISDMQGLEDKIYEHAAEVTYEVPVEGTASPAVRDLFNATFAFHINEQLVREAIDRIQQYQRATKAGAPSGGLRSTAQAGGLPGADGSLPSPEAWKSSGRASKTWPNKEDRIWWEHHGPLFIGNWLRWKLTSGWQLAYADGKPAVELDISNSLAGFAFKGLLDRVMLDTSFNPPLPVVVDLKSSARTPTSGEQLGAYAMGLELLGLPRPPVGYYFDVRTRGLVGPFSLAEYSADHFAWKWGRMQLLKEHDLFEPNTDPSVCNKVCAVREHCSAVSGPKAHLVPPPWRGAAGRRLPLINLAQPASAA